MIPDFEKRLSDKIEQASLKEVMPDFDKELEWQQLSQELNRSKRRSLVPVWAYAAAIAALLTVAFLTPHIYVPAPAAQTDKSLADQSAAPAPVSAVTTTVANKDTNPVPQPVPPVVSGTAPQLQHKNRASQKTLASDVIHNNTDCPIELRISQVMSCPNDKPKAISTSSTVEPDQAGQLKYKENNSVASNCSLTVKEIEIVSIGTGERIVLNSSSPTTAQEVFSYITGEKKGYVLAGMFNYDCEKRNHKRSLKLNNSNGNLVIE